MQRVMEKKPGIYTYEAQWPICALAWSVRSDKKTRLGIGSFIEDYNNKVELVQFNEDTTHFYNDARLVLDHPYSPTRLLFFPSESTSNPDLVATSGDYLRLWEIHDDRIELKSLLNSNKTSEYNSPITSFDWAEFNCNRVATCSIDTTCTIWDIEREIVDSQLVAHDKEVYDISWGAPGVFASVSGDGSVRVFDLRDKERSTIIYENNNTESPLLRLEWNRADLRFMATVGMDSNKVVVLDIRFPTTPLLELRKHKGSVNSIAWAPHTGRQLCSVGDDARALLWELPIGGVRPESDEGHMEPVMWYSSAAEINQVSWSSLDPNWIAIALLNKIQLLKV